MSDGPTGITGQMQQMQGWRGWQIYTTMFGVLFSMAMVIFRAGGTDAKTEVRLLRLEADAARIETDYVRKDVLEQRLNAIERTEKRIEDSEAQQKDMLDEILTDRGIRPPDLYPRRR